MDNLLHLFDTNSFREQTPVHPSPIAEVGVWRELRGKVQDVIQGAFHLRRITEENLDDGSDDGELDRHLLVQEVVNVVLDQFLSILKNIAEFAKHPYDADFGFFLFHSIRAVLLDQWDHEVDGDIGVLSNDVLRGGDDGRHTLWPLPGDGEEQRHTLGGDVIALHACGGDSSNDFLDEHNVHLVAVL